MQAVCLKYLNIECKHDLSTDIVIFHEQELYLIKLGKFTFHSQCVIDYQGCDISFSVHIVCV